jgi:uncharacterized Tic20 family protein
MTEVTISIPESDRSMAMLTHLSGLAGYIVPAGGIIVPIIILMVRNDSAHITSIAKQAIWLNLAVFTLVVVGILLLLTVILIPVVVLAWVVFGLAAVVLPIVGAIKANQGIYYKYPVVGVTPVQA